MARYALKPAPGFRWADVMWGKPESPRSALCSHLDCLKAIGEDEVPLIFWREDGSAAQFCTKCTERWFGFQSKPDSSC